MKFQRVKKKIEKLIKIDGHLEDILRKIFVLYYFKKIMNRKLKGRLEEMFKKNLWKTREKL